MSGEAGLTVVIVCTRPQSQLLGGAPFAAESELNAATRALITCVPQVFAVVTAKVGLTSSQKECCVRSGSSLTTSARISAPVSPPKDCPVVAETTAKSSSNTLCKSVFRKAWNKKHAAELVSVAWSATGALFGSGPVSPVGQSYGVAVLLAQDCRSVRAFP